MKLGRPDRGTFYLLCCLAGLFVLVMTESFAQETQGRSGEVTTNQQGLNTECEFDQFKSALGARESGGDYTIVNQYGYMGKYQFGRSTMNGVQANDPSLPVVTNAEFLASPEIQERYFESLIRQNQAELRRRGMDQYIGQTINGVVVTESGILAAMHLKGGYATLQYLQSNGTNDGKDGNGTALSSYLAKFGGYNIPGAGASAGDGCGFVPHIDSPRDQGYEGCCPRFCDLPPRSLGMAAGLVPSIPDIPDLPYGDYEICDGASCPVPYNAEAVQAMVAQVEEKCTEPYKTQVLESLASCSVGGLTDPLPCEMFSFDPSQATGTVITVSNRAEFLQALQTVESSGGTILLNAGDYDKVYLNNYNPGGKVTIASADGSNRAMFNEMQFHNSSNMMISNLSFQYEGKAGPDGQQATLELSYTNNIQVSNNMFNGYTTQPGDYTPNPNATDRMHEIPLDGYGTGLGFRTEFSDDITVGGNTFNNLSWGSVNTHTDNVRFIGNTYTRMTVDAMNGTGGTNILYQGNYVTQNNTPPGMSHDDSLQYRIASIGPTNLQIIGNYIDAGMKQGFYLGNECIEGSSVDGLTTTGSCDPAVGRYHGVRIEGNTIIGAQAHGISLGTGDDIEILNNTAVTACGERYNTAKQIATSQFSRNVTMIGNHAPRVGAFRSGTGVGRIATPSEWTMRDNEQNAPCQTPQTLTQAPGCAAVTEPINP